MIFLYFSGIFLIMHLNKFLYLFLVDPVRLFYGHDYVSYIKTEPGYSQSWLKAYLATFNDSRDGKITHQLLKKINRQAMAFSPESHGGEYKKDCNHFEIAKMDAKDAKRSINVCIPTYSTNMEGMREFLSYWLINDDESIHILSFGWRNEGDDIPLFSIEKCLQDNDRLLWTEFSSGVKTEYTLDFETSVKKINCLLNNFAYLATIDSGINIADGHAAPIVFKKLEKIFREFDHEMAGAMCADEKITCIVRHVQHIAQLHPFLDGNIRTCYILINKLLRDHDLPLTILLNPNRLDCCSVSSIVEMVKLGQEYYLQLLNCTDENLIFKTSESIEKLKIIVCTPQVLVDIEDERLLSDFANYVVKNLPIIQASIAGNPHCMFFDKTSIAGEVLASELREIINGNPSYALIQQAFDERNYGLGFRRACALGSYQIVETILSYNGKIPLDMNGQSSNGNTALDWLAQSKKCGEETKSIIKELLNYYGCLGKTSLNPN